MKTIAATFSILLVLFAAVGRAAEPDDASPGSALLRYRRVYVPEGATNWPKGDAKYLPMEAAEFERLLGAIQRTEQKLPTQSAAGFDKAQYVCRLKGRSLLQGSAVLDVSSAIANAAPLTLDRCSLAIDRPRWTTSEGEPAVLGMASDGRLQVLAERAGRLEFEWSLSGQNDAAGATSFVVHLPPCSVTELRVELPAELTPSADRGVLTDEGLAEPEFRRWRIDLGGWSAFNLRIAGKGEADARRPVVLVDQTAAYHVSLHGVDVSVDWNVGAHREPLREFAFELESPLEVLEVGANEQPLPWRRADKPRSKRPRVVVDIPAPLQEGALKLRVRAVAPLTIDETWKIPRMLVADAVCRKSTLQLEVESPLRIAAVTRHGCSQMGAASLKSPPGEQFNFELYDPDGGAELLLTRQRTNVQAISATTTVIGQGKMSSRVAADFHTSEGPVFVLEAAVLPFWAIDSVTSQPADVLDDWTVQSRGGARVLSLRLARPLTSARPLRLIVSARRLYAGSSRRRDVSLNLDDVAPLRFSAPIECRRLIDLRTGSENELHVAASQRPWRVDVKELTAAELDLFADPPGDVLLRDHGGTDGVRLLLAARRPAYTADIRVEAVVAAGTLEENYAILCTPTKNAPIDRFVVHFVGRRNAQLAWSATGSDELTFSARRWTAAQESAAGLTADEEEWDVALASRQSTPLELHAQRKSKIDGPISLCLASLPDAASQQARVVVRNLGPQAVQFKTQRVTPLPIERAPLGQIQTARAAFRYDPREETTPQISPAVEVICAESALPSTWAWDCNVRSQFAADGMGSHRITYRLENAGDRRVTLKLPATLTRGDVHELSINGQPATAFSADANANVIAIDLPTTAKNVELALRISTRGRALGAFQRLRPPLPDIGLPVFSQHWTVELPPGYETLRGGQDAESSAADSYNLQRRLLGCLGRNAQQKVFNPLRGSDWRTLFRIPQSGDLRDSDEAPAREAAATAGWSQYHVDLAGGDASIAIIHQPAVEAAGWLLFLAIVALGAWPRSANGRPVWRNTLIALAVVCGPCALLLPANLAGVFSCGLLGLAFCFLLALVRRKKFRANPPSANRPRELPSTLSNAIPFAAPVFLAMLLCCAGSAAAEPKEPPAAHSVYIPVNEKQEPTGGKYLVPETLFSELYRRAGQHAEKPQGWMIASALYRAALAEDAAQRELAVEHLIADYEIHVFAAAARIRIPLCRDEVSLVPDQAKLDDRSVQPEWEADGSALLLDIAEPGEYRLELALRPNARPESRSGGFDLAVPRVPTARLEVAVPSGGPSITVPSALGAVHWEEIPSRWVIELGPTKRLAIRWPDAAAEEPVNVQLLQWLKVEPGCVLLDVRVKAKASTGQLRRLQLKADAALELLADAAAAMQPTVTRASDGMQTIDCRISPSTAEETTLDLHFLCAGMSSTGTLRAPQIEVLGSHLTRRRLAVSVDRLLEYQLPAAGRAPSTDGRRAGAPDAAAVPEFLGSWGVAETPPDLAFHLNDSAAEWSLTTRARKPETSGDLETCWEFDEGHSQVQFDARLSTSGGNVFQYRVALPPELLVDSLAVNCQGSAVPSRWVAQPDGRLTLFLESPVAGRHQLQLRGRLPVPMNRRFPLPQLRLEDVRIQNSVVRLYQREPVAAEVFAPAGLTEVKPSAESLGDGAPAKLLRSFYVDPVGASAVSVVLRLARAPQVQPEAAAAPHSAPPPQTLGAARIAAADVRYAWQAGGRSIGAAMLDVASPSVGDYPLELPAGFDLLQLTVDGVPVDAVRGANETWIVPLLPHGPKSRIEMLFAAEQTNVADTASSLGRITFQSPRLGALPVERTTWTIAAPRSLQAISADAKGSSVAVIPATEFNSGDLASQWRAFADRGGSLVSYAVIGPSDAITLNYRAVSSSYWLPRLLSTMGFLGAIAVVAWGLRRGTLQAWCVQLPSLVGIALGLAWWLWASPSALGLVIVLAVVVRKLVAARGSAPLSG